ncbi:hypothetical protein EON81_03580, partial [bacterium]
VVVWGRSDYGQANVPTGLVATEAVAGGLHCLALRPNGTVVGWGYNVVGQCNPPAGLVATQVAAGTNHSLALRPDGTVAAWGINSEGECDVPAGLTAIQVAAGGYHCLALRPDGTVAGWGYNSSGQSNPPAGLVATQVTAGGFHSLAVKKDDTVAAWGYNGYGQCDVPAGLVATQVTAGRIHSLALRADGTVAAWGYNGYGQCDVPAGLVNVVQMAAGEYHSLALRADGTVVAWGYGPFGECDVPSGLTGVLRVSAELNHSLALVAAAHCILDQKEVYAGDSATGTVKLADPAPAGGTVVTLLCDDPTVSVPARVTVPEGATTATFPVFTSSFFGAERNATIRTDYNGTATVPARLRVKATAVAAAFGAASFTGGAATQPTLTVSFNQAQTVDATFALASSDPALAVAASVTVPAGETSVNVPYTAALVATTTNATISLSYGGVPAASATVTLVPVTASLSFDRPSVFGGSTTKPGLTVTASARMRDDLTVSLSAHPALGAPATVTIPGGTTSRKIVMTTGLVAAPTTVPVAATLGGRTLDTATITLQPIRATVSFETTPLSSGASSLGFVNLTAPVAQAATISLASSDPSVTVPATVRVNANSSVVHFPITTTATGADRSVIVTATLGGVSSKATLRLLAAALIRSFTVSPTTASAGGTATLKVALGRAVTTDTVVALSSADPLVSIPATVTIPAGSLSATALATIGATATGRFVALTATLRGTSLTRNLKVTP